jgi:hypothetical protein
MLCAPQKQARILPNAHGEQYAVTDALIVTFFNHQGHQVHQENDFQTLGVLSALGGKFGFCSLPVMREHQNADNGQGEW